MADQKPRKDGAAELREEDLKKVRGGDFSLGFRPIDVEVDAAKNADKKGQANS